MYIYIYIYIYIYKCIYIYIYRVLQCVAVRCSALQCACLRGILTLQVNSTTSAVTSTHLNLFLFCSNYPRSQF